MIRNTLRITWKARYAISDLLYRYNTQSVRWRKELRKLKRAYVGMPLLVIGNGPSLNRTPLDRFDEIASIGMNKIDLIFEKTTWRPSMIVCTNSVVVRQHYESFLSSSIPVWIAYKTRMSIPYSIRKRFNYFSIRPSYDFSDDLVRGVGAGETVTYAALQFAYYMGASPVILFGVDHNFDTKAEDKLKYVKQTGEDMNHFHKDYFKSGTYWGVPDLEQSEWLYRKCKKKFEDEGREIYDATVGGKLDIFEKITVETAIDLCKIKKGTKENA